MNIEAFLSAYIECALWSSTDNSDDSGGDPLDDNYNAEDIAPETHEQMLRDCESFCDANATLLEECRLLSPASEWGFDAQCGHDFWLSRNGHGAGFFDRGYAEVGDKLQKACKPYGSVYLYVNEDDELIYGE